MNPASAQDPMEAIDRALAEMERARGSAPRKAPERSRRRFRPLRWLVGLLLLGVAPFLLLLRGATLLYEHTAMPDWGTLAAAALGTALLLTVYVWLGARRLGVRAGKWAPRAALLVVVFYCVYGLVFLSPDHVKRPEIRDEYTSLHPIVRVALSTLVLFDSGLVVTDASRVPEDYATMNLPALNNSHHYVQADGYVHAVDLRTVGRPEWATFGVTWYFRAVGLKVLRHVGTADHLHVYLPPR